MHEVEGAIYHFELKCRADICCCCYCFAAHLPEGWN